MSFQPTAGQFAVLKISIVGGGSDIVVPAQDWKGALDGKVADVSNFRDGRARVGTLPDASWTATLVWDAGEQPTKTATTGLRLNALGTAKFFTDGTHFFSAPVIVSQVSPENQGVEGVVMYPVTLELNGAITYPTDP